MLKRLCRDYGLISDGGSVVERYALKQEQVQVAPGGEFMLREDVVCFVVENYLVDVMRLKFGGFTRDLLWCAFLKAGAEFYACYVDEDETVRVDDLMMDSKVEFVTGERCWLTRRVRME